MIGIPRDSYVDIAGHGRNKINASMFYGGPQLMADSVGRLVGVRPDYVFTTGFLGFRAMVRAIGGVTVNSRFAFSDPVRPQGYHVGRNKLNPFQALIFGRVRHPLPHGDFDRSGNQQELLRSILRKVRAHQSQPGLHGARACWPRPEEHGHRPQRPPSSTGSPRRSPTIQPGQLQGCVVQRPHRVRRRRERGLPGRRPGPPHRQRRPPGRDPGPRLLSGPGGERRERWNGSRGTSAPGRIRTYATASGGRCSIP